jgi:hypothetical protein
MSSFATFRSAGKRHCKDTKFPLGFRTRPVPTLTVLPEFEPTTSSSTRWPSGVKDANTYGTTYNLNLTDIYAPYK